MSGEQDIRRMGGLAPHIRITWAMMLIGSLSLTGFPFTAGYYSKDAIIESSFASHAASGTFAYVLLIVAAFCTSFYSWRLLFLTFHGKSRVDKDTMSHVHESPPVMMVPLYVLALGALAAGFIFAPYFIGHDETHFWGESILRLADNKIVEEMHHVPAWVVWSPFVMLVLGFALAYYFYIRNPEAPARLAEQHEPVYKFLLNKWYFDELYDLIFVRTAKCLGYFLWKKGDGWLIDGWGPDGVSARVIDVTNRVVKLQTGYLYHYAFAMLVGVAALVTWFMFGGAH
jgi:NADH-quinone oxidoreductase subunit L